MRRLAWEGGEPEFPAGPPVWPPYDDEVADVLARAARDGSWGRYDGPHGLRLASAIGETLQVDHVQLCSSGTIGVELALRGAGVGADDEVLLAGYDFPGNFRAIEAIGARPALVDLAPGGWTPGIEAWSAGWGPQVKALIVSHLHGSLAPMRRLVDEAQARQVTVIEDVCQAPGAIVDGKTAGRWGDAAVFSFGGSKLLTAGRGGAVVTARADLAQRMKVFSDRGNQAFPLSELQAAVLLPQWKRLPDANRRRQASVDRLLGRLAGLDALQPARPADPAGRPSYYKLSWFYEPGERGLARERLVAAVRAEGVALDEAFRGFAGRSGQRCRKCGDLEESRRAARATVLLHHPVLLADDATVDRVADVLRRVVERLG